MDDTAQALDKSSTYTTTKGFSKNLLFRPVAEMRCRLNRQVTRVLPPKLSVDRINFLARSAVEVGSEVRREAGEERM
ncbi:hypothetical protein [Burkholderia multivorans]|uniref:hypothetical protein n=1 Tax=Burkholderia multivorans TaxID=87883 RepID=UPI000F4E38A5|nr:hypothetical protein [Burkholderia multivorans]MBU9222716.1 hypothetical protein [Burkholderia multivorans]MBU9623997.1 hypothetical protein [Burkholderia multivorans]MCA8410258.1 hypothetical protein [Burkholderia multivorans]MCA8437309.1 hypothetical protein [Burkholderia multivorans]